MIKRRYLGIMVCCLFFLGCSITEKQYQIIEDPSPQLRRFVSTNQVRAGLTQSEVQSLLGQEIVVGYEMPDSQQQLYKPIVLKNPQRSETYTQGSHEYVIDYYLVGINQSDGVITDDELTPMIFEKEALVGWGWGFLNRIKK